MTTERKTAIVIGSLFLISTANFLIGDELIGSIVATPEYLKNSYPNANRITFGSILQLVNDIVVVGIGVMFLPILKKYNPNIAFAYMGSRIIEGALLLVSAVSLLLIIPLSEEYLKAANSDVSYFETLGVLLKKGRYITFQMAMISLSIGSLFLCYLLYKVKLVPRIIAILGLIGYASLLFKMGSEILGYEVGGDNLYLPGALFEILLPFRLIIKGFNVSTNELKL